MDRASQLRLNAIIFQVRPGCDALYSSSIEPWSEYLTGTMGQAPSPFYDPLAFATEQAHQRGLELHAWFNPYRAHHSAARSPVSSTHVSKTHPEWVRQYGRSLWLDPGEPAVQDYSIKVILDVVTRYDIDGVHIDDYFYPYPERDGSGKEMDFPDGQTWSRWGKATRLSRDDWRRENVNTFVSRAYKSIKAAKPWVTFGISPFGIWRPQVPSTIRGFDAYDKLYADSRKWLLNGWCDYFAPQLYWAIDPKEQSFPVLLAWWAEQNKLHRLLVPGMDTTKTLRRWPADELLNQIRLTRKQANAGGHIHWNMKALLRNGELEAKLRRETYQQPALVPACSWLDRSEPAKPELRAAVQSAKVRLTWSSTRPEPLKAWLLQTRTESGWASRVLPAERDSLELTAPLPKNIALTAVDRYGNASRPAVIQLQSSKTTP